jgi:hypothetical protein
VRLEPFRTCGGCDIHDPGLQAEGFLWARRAYRLKLEADIRIEFLAYGR